MSLSVRQQLDDEVRLLSDELAEEVLDFVQFLRARSEERAFLWEQVEETYRYRKQHPDDVMTVSASEWLSLTDELAVEG